MTIEKTLSERGSRYGSFADQAAIEQDILDRLSLGQRWQDCAPDQRSSVYMICVKLARIVNGDPDYIDNWHDIIGYAKLIENRLAARIEAGTAGTVKQGPARRARAGIARPKGAA